MLLSEGELCCEEVFSLLQLTRLMSRIKVAQTDDFCTIREISEYSHRKIGNESSSDLLVLDSRNTADSAVASSAQD